jgi:plastocyanin
MRVPPQSGGPPVPPESGDPPAGPRDGGVPVAWLIRAVLLVGVVTIGWIGFAPSQSDAPADEPTVAVAAPTTPPLPTATAQPTQTPQAITSIIVRQTAAPYPTSTPFPSGLTSVSVVDFSYMPNSVRIQTGQSVLWRNDGTEQHDVTGSDWHSGPLDPGYTYRLTFGIAGTYPYRCSIHLDMTGTVVVT